MKSIITFILAISAAVLTAAPLQIAKDGKSVYLIALPESPSVVDKTAAKELQTHLQKITGSVLPVVTEKAVGNKPAFFIGNTALFKKNFAKNATLQKPDAIALKADGKNIILGGHPTRGQLYAVYEFLEKYCNIRWWTSKESTIPANKNLTVDVKEYVYAPALEYREVYALDAKGAEFASRLRSNGFWTNLNKEYGDKLFVYGWCHTFEQIMPPSKYFKQHPEWFALVNGKHMGQGAQLCLTNQEMRKEFLKLVFEKFKRYPYMWQMSISQNDYHNWCECDNCMALQKKEGSESGPLLDFVNYIAREVGKVYPNVPISTLAYQKSRRVPKTIKPEDNVYIWLCNIENNFGESMEDGKSNADFRRDIEDWSKISKQLFIWNYTAFFGNFMVPHPNHASIGKDIRYFVKMKAKGIFPQGDFYCNIGDFAALRSYVMGKMLWNPELDERAVTMEFLQGYYGKAAPYLMEYLDYICDRAVQTKTFVSCYKHLHSFDWFTPETAVKCYDIFAKAANAVKDNPLFAERVRRERLSLDHLYLSTLPAAIRDAKRLKKPLPSYGPDFMKLMDEYTVLTKKYNPAFIALSYRYGSTNTKMKQAIINAMDKTPADCRNVPGNRWVKYEAHEFGLHKFNPKNKSEIWAEIVNDPAADDKSAVRMPGNHHQWAMQMGLRGYGEDERYTNNVDPKKKYIVSIWARAEGKASSGPAITVGIYSNNRRKIIGEMQVDISKCKGKKYRRFSLPALILDDDVTMFIAPTARPAEEISAIFIDKITLIRQK